MKFSLIGPVYPYRGGISHFTSMLCKSLIVHHHTVSLVSFSRQYPTWLYPGRTDRDPGPDSFNLQAAYLLDPIAVRSWNRTSHHVIDFLPDAVILPWWTTYMAPVYTYLSYRFRQENIPVIFLIHNVLPHEQKPWDRALAKMALGKGDKFIVQSEQEATRLTEVIPGANHVICSHPIYDMFSARRLPKNEAKNQLGIPPNTNVLLFFGIVRQYKGLDTLIQALDHLQSKDIHPKLIIAGEFWQDKESMTSLIEQMKLKEQVIIEDRYISDQDVPKYFSAADIFVAPYKKGTQSGVVKLALGFELPVILSETIADPAILSLNNYPLYITPPGDPIALARNLEIALGDLKDRTDDSPRLVDSGWDDMVQVIESAVLEFSETDE